MSGVSKSHRSEAATEYVLAAQKPYRMALTCAMRLPKRWTFFVSASMVRHAKSANSIWVSCVVDAQLRRMRPQQAYRHAQTLSSLVDETYLMGPVRAKGQGDCERLKPCIAEGAFSCGSS